MNLSDVYKVSVPRKRRKRKGRGEGSGKGKTAGRGTKGQQARAGYSRLFGAEGGQIPLFRRLPKRGFNNTRFAVSYSIVNLSDLHDFEAGATVDLAALKERGRAPRNAERLKVLANGTLDRALTVKAQKFSASAREAIQAAGGTAEEISS